MSEVDTEHRHGVRPDLLVAEQLDRVDLQVASL
jgi:hypothetical protein